MAKEELQPMIKIVRPGQCDECLGPLTIIDHDMSISVLSASGYPTSTENAYSEIYGMCTNCGKRFDMMKTGMGYEKYSRTAELYKDFLKQNFELNDCDKELRDENPFATIARRYKNV